MFSSDCAVTFASTVTIKRCLSSSVAVCSLTHTHHQTGRSEGVSGFIGSCCVDVPAGDGMDNTTNKDAPHNSLKLFVFIMLNILT